MTARAAAANHLGHLLIDGGPRARTSPITRAQCKTIVDWRTVSTPRPGSPTRSPSVAPPHELTDFQNGFYEMARLLRQAGLPGGHP